MVAFRLKFKIDENLPGELADLLRSFGHDAATLHDQSMAGCNDDHVATVCQSEGRTLVTLDLDFADLRRYPASDMCGVVVLRLIKQDRESVLKTVRGIASLLLTEPLHGRLWIVDESSVRIRGDQP